ncbi:response regulator [Rhizosaccharibacter radicis]|uniref:Response regulator n=1 Tax=Rhizosaccharibacter radicis TaxID=2782605 RepID=A0ABT1VTB7_9PROT|nr:response regulator [Acetobacteraceae bacterium KSS12]
MKKMCLLLVDDEVTIREMIAEWMADDGFIIRMAANADEAFDLVKQPPRAIRALVTDLHMAGDRDGVHVAQLVRRRFPDAVILVITGRPDAERLHDLDAGCRVMSKPFRLDEVRNHILSHC